MSDQHGTERRTQLLRRISRTVGRIDHAGARVWDGDRWVPLGIALDITRRREAAHRAQRAAWGVSGL